MLNREMLLATSEQVLGWKVKVSYVSKDGMVGGNQQEDIIPLGGAPALSLLATSLPFENTRIYTIAPHALHVNDSLQNASSSATVIIWDGSSTQYIAEGENLFTTADIGKTITVYYIPA